MATKTLTVYEALLEIKKLKKLLTQKENDSFISQGYTTKQIPMLISTKKKSADTINNYPAEEVIKAMKSELQSITHLLSNYKEYTAKVNLSNATTKVEIGGIEYTVAEAISRKNMIGFEQKFLQTLRAQYVNATNKLENEMQRVNSQDNIDKYLANALGNSKNVEAQQLKDFTKVYHDQYDWELVDPNNLKSTIIEMEANLEEFENSVNFKLAASNATTQITVVLED